MVPVLYKYVFA